MKWRNEGDYER
ncbi:hypothetical protein TGP89_258105A, partial [Toxoplasma gondii p89]